MISDDYYQLQKLNWPDSPTLLPLYFFAEHSGKQLLKFQMENGKLPISEVILLFANINAVQAFL